MAGSGSNRCSNRSVSHSLKMGMAGKNKVGGGRGGEGPAPIILVLQGSTTAPATVWEGGYRGAWMERETKTIESGKK